MQLDSFSGLFRNHIIELPSEIFTWERKVLSQYNLSEDILPIVALDTLLVLIGQNFENLLWLSGDNFIKHGDQFEKLGSHRIHFHSHCSCEFLQIPVSQISLYTVQLSNWSIY